MQAPIVDFDWSRLPDVPAPPGPPGFGEPVAANLEIAETPLVAGRAAKSARQLERPSLGIELVSTVDAFERLRPDYERLHRTTNNRLPFALHDWHVAWWKHFAARDGHVRDALKVYVVRDGANRCRAIIPLVATDRRFGPFHLRTLSMLGPDPYISELRGPLIEPGMELEVANLLRESLAEGGQWDWIFWSGVQGAFADAIGRRHNVEWRESTVEYVLNLPPTWEAFRAGLKRNIRESLRHCYNSLKRDGHEFQFEVAREPADVAVAVEHFLTLHTMRADMTGTVHHRNRFDGPKTKNFLRDVCTRLSARGSTRVFLLKIRGEVVAARLGFVVGDGLYLYFSGYNPAWAKYSVMTTTVAEAIKYAIEQKLSTVSLSAGTDVSKTRWGATPVVWAEGFECRQSLRSRMAHEAYRRASEWRQAVPTGSMMLDLLPKRAW